MWRTGVRFATPVRRADADSIDKTGVSWQDAFYYAEHGTVSKAILMGREELLMMQLFGGGGASGWMPSGGWLQVVYLAFLFAIPIFRPERIRVASSYRGAYLCFALSIIVPSAASVLMMNLLSPGGVTADGLSGIQLLQLFNAAGPVLFGISIILAMKAIVPGFIPPQSARRPTNHDDPSSTAGGD